MAIHFRNPETGLYEAIKIPVVKGDKGTTFTPSVDEDGNLTWTNNDGEVNPTPVNIKGDTGAKGEHGSPGIHVGSTAPTDPDIKVWFDTSDNSADVELAQIVLNLKQMVDDFKEEIGQDLENIVRYQEI